MKNILILFILLCPVWGFSQLDTVNTGSYPGAGDGDKGYYAFSKVNAAINRLNSLTGTMDSCVSLESDTLHFCTHAMMDSSLSVQGHTYFMEGASVDWDEVNSTTILNLSLENSTDYIYIYATSNISINILNLSAGESLICIEQDPYGHTITKGTGWGSLIGGGEINTNPGTVSLIQFEKIVPTTRAPLIRHFIIAD